MRHDNLICLAPMQQLQRKLFKSIHIFRASHYRFS